MISKTAWLCLLALLVAVAGPAQAGRPMNTDDASISPEGGSQVESWLRVGRDLHELVVQPACNPWGGVEWGLNLASGRASGAATSTFGWAAKMVFKEVEAGGVGVGMSGGVSRQKLGGSTANVHVATLIVSAAPTDALALHVNAGATHVTGRSAMATWAAAAEFGVARSWTIVLEAYGERHARPAVQLGARKWLQPDRLQLDASLGREAIDGSRRTLVTIGMAWYWADAKP